mmetsp:Transcript_2650/g.4035  ORF Transcript_2650/g.4035 Transcript_2650/m.4035 type:complete len:118 (+) Transcript_2650:3-356(+)
MMDLELSSNRLNGTIPSELGNLMQLATLYLHNNTLTGEIPSEIGKLTQLTKLDLSFNQLNGIAPSELNLLPNLQYINVSGNNNFSGNLTFLCENGNHSVYTNDTIANASCYCCNIDY